MILLRGHTVVNNLIWKVFSFFICYANSKTKTRNHCGWRIV